jgi:serine/threonine-protein kinase
VSTEPAEAVAPTEPLEAARVAVGPYELLVELASGGMATVFLARARDGRALAPLVAIKRPHRHLATDKNFIAMLLDEARIASSIAHDNVVRVRELRFDGGEPSIVMDYVEGASLSDLRKELVAAHRAFDPKVAVRIVLDALAGLHAAHELCDAAGKPLGLVHRDVSPHNVLVGADGRSRLADFGVAHAEDRFQETRTQEVKGKLAYLSPERVDRRRICTRQSDVFAMGIVLWECIAGRRLFRGDEAVDTLQEVMHLPIPRLRQIGCDVPRPLDDAVARALSRDMDIRFATALDFAVALERAVGPSGVGSAEQVAGLVMAVYGARLAERHEQVRRVLADDPGVEKLFDDAGLGHPQLLPLAAALDAVAPMAPSERYAFGGIDRRFGSLVERPTRWALVAGVAAGLLLGIGGTVTVATTRSRASAPPSPTATAPVVTPLPTEAPTRSLTPPPSAQGAAPSGPTRPLTVRLPFLTSRVTIDGVDHEVSPPADELVLDIPVEAEIRHHIVAMALDGSLAKADVTEEGGVAVARDSVVVVTPMSGPPGPGGSGLPPVPRPGVLRNGFTKLK